MVGGGGLGVEADRNLGSTSITANCITTEQPMPLQKRLKRNPLPGGGIDSCDRDRVTLFVFVPQRKAYSSARSVRLGFPSNRP